jgi:hypothetical protein
MTQRHPPTPPDPDPFERAAEALDSFAAEQFGLDSDEWPTEPTPRTDADRLRSDADRIRADADRLRSDADRIRTDPDPPITKPPNPEPPIIDAAPRTPVLPRTDAELRDVMHPDSYAMLQQLAWSETGSAPTRNALRREAAHPWRRRVFKVTLAAVLLAGLMFSGLILQRLPRSPSNTTNEPTSVAELDRPNSTQPNQVNPTDTRTRAEIDAEIDALFPEVARPRTAPPAAKDTPPVVTPPPLVADSAPPSSDPAPVVKEAPPSTKPVPPSASVAVATPAPSTTKNPPLVVKADPPDTPTASPVTKPTPPVAKATPSVTRDTASVAKAAPPIAKPTPPAGVVPAPSKPNTQVQATPPPRPPLEPPLSQQIRAAAEPAAPPPATTERIEPPALSAPPAPPSTSAPASVRGPEPSPPAAAAAPAAAAPAANTVRRPEAVVPAAGTKELDTNAIQATLSRYRDAYTALDAGAAHQVWPTVNQRTLQKAFERLKQQQVSFDRCRIDVGDARAQAVCNGTQRYVPRIGSSTPQVDQRQWTFNLVKVRDEWLIGAVDAR